MTTPDHDPTTPVPPGADPFLDEVRTLKRDALARAGGTLEGVFRHLRQVEELHRDRVVRAQPESVSDGHPPGYASDDDATRNR